MAAEMDMIRRLFLIVIRAVSQREIVILQEAKQARAVTLVVDPVGDERRCPGVEKTFRGCSMKGTFSTGDILTVDSVAISTVRPGDVVVFRQPGSLPGLEIVHRVLSLSSCGLVTRGDSAKGPDIWPVTEDLLVGRVSYKERCGRHTVVYGGRRGQVCGRLLNTYWAARRWVVNIIEKPYSMLRDSRLVGLFWRPKLVRVLVGAGEDVMIQFVHNKKIVARFWPGKNDFECRKPWDLVIDLKDLLKK